jgi:trypsin
MTVRASLIASCAVVASLFAATPAGAVIGGRPVAAAANPAIVKLQSCSASLIAPTRVLTAAHCARLLVPHATRLTIGGATYTVARVARDPQYAYRQRTYADATPYAPPYDVAIAELDRPVAGVVPLALRRAPVPPGTAARTIGFGVDRLTGSFGTLRAASVVTRGDATCRAAIRRADPKQVRLYKPGLMVCVQDPDRRKPYRSACNGDSGSPLLIGGRVAGVDAWGVDCGTRVNDPANYITIPSVLAFVTAAAPPWEPEPATPTTISGTPTVGSTLTCIPPAWAGAPPATTRFDWETPHGGAGAATYTVWPQDAGGEIRCRTEADIQGGGTLYFTSAPVRVVVPATS